MIKAKYMVGTGFLIGMISGIVAQQYNNMFIALCSWFFFSMTFAHCYSMDYIKIGEEDQDKQTKSL